MKILIISEKQTILYNALLYFLDREIIEYELWDRGSSEIPNDVTNIIYIDYGINDNSLFLSNVSIPVIVITNSLKLIDNDKTTINYIITPLVHDETAYTPVQKEYIYQKGIYSIIIDKVYELTNNDTEINGLVMDVSNCKTKLIDWVFKFDSIAETYAWLSRKNVSNYNFTEKIVNFYHEKVYNDSSKEINYLADKINNIQNGLKTMDLFVCTKEEFEIFKSNYFFKLLLKNTNTTYNMYTIDRNLLEEKEPFILGKLLDGVAIYEDCVYIDNYNDEYSLGRVDCNKKTIEEYNQYFDYVIEKYAHKISTEGDVNGI